ncbi:MAG: hypothetical protein HY959_13265 [Ignavibacteriae bacterium]|nr:hypothetical protein [Ignavibacteriota bacterium]
MKTRILINGLAVAFILFSFSGCGLLKKAETSSSFAGRQIVSEDTNNPELQSEELLYDISDNRSQGLNYKYAGNYEQVAPDEQISDNYNKYEEEEILNENPLPVDEEASLDEFESKLSSDGDFVKISEEEIDSDNNVSTETTYCDVDVYTNVIWVPKIKYVYVGWNPYTNGRWVWTRYGWTWKSYYHWGRYTYHYGRWWYSHRYGWVWSPGRRWAPGWVMWRHHGHYTGWHPISPRVRHHNGVISPIMPRLNNGWVIVKKEDFTKKVNNTTIITGTKKNEIIKITDPVITLKKDGNILTNKNTGVIKNEMQTKKTDTKKVNYVNTASDKEKNTKYENTVSTKKQNTLKNENKSADNELKNTERNTRKKKENNTVKSVNVNTTNESRKKSDENINKRQNNSLSSNNTTKNETRTVVKDNQKKESGKKNNSTEYNTNSNNTKTNNTVTKKTENTGKSNEKVVTKSENKNSFVKETPKVEQKPRIEQKQKVEQAPKVEHKQKTEQAPKVEQKQKTEQAPKINKEKAPEIKKNNGTKKGD